MLVCICNAIKEDELREVARHGVTCPEEAYAVLGKTPMCRICLEHAEDIMTEERTACACRPAPRDSRDGEAAAYAPA